MTTAGSRASEPVGEPRQGPSRLPAEKLAVAKEGLTVCCQKCTSVRVA